MSELALSFHFLRATRTDVREFAIARGIGGRVVASNVRWACFVPFDREDERAALTRWGGVVLKWSYSEDCGLDLEFYRAGHELGVASFIWETMFTGQPPGGTLPEALRVNLVADEVLSARDIAEWDQILADCAAGTASGEDVRDQVAAILDLAAFSHLSPGGVPASRSGRSSWRIPRREGHQGWLTLSSS